jgi:hypothetical protein
MNNMYDIDDFISKKQCTTDEKYKEHFDKNKIIEIKLQILKELNIKDNNNNDFVWRRENILSNSLKKINKDVLNINSEINKLTQNKFLMIYKNIIEILFKKTELPIDIKVNYLLDGLFEKSLIHINFNSLYICFLQKLLENKKIKNYIETNLKTIQNSLENIIKDINLIKTNNSDKKYLLLLKQNKDINKQYQYLGNIYSLLYLYNIIDKTLFFNFMNEYLIIIDDCIKSEASNKNNLEKVINILIGLLEYGFLKLKNELDNDKKINFCLNIEKILKKKISLRIKFNLKNMLDDLNSGSKEIIKYDF